MGSEKHSANLIKKWLDKKYAHKQITIGKNQQSPEGLKRTTFELQCCYNDGRLAQPPNPEYVYVNNIQKWSKPENTSYKYSHQKQ